MSVNQFGTLIEALEDLRKRGFTRSFDVGNGKVTCQETGEEVHTKDVKIVEHHRFEGVSNPDDMSVVYAIECSDGSKGTIIDAYGAYADSTLADLLHNAKIDEEGEQ